MAKSSITVEEMLATTDPNSRVDSLNFEEGVGLLEDLVKSVESGSLSLERSILSYERGMLLIEKLKERLDGAEERLKLLQQDGSEEESEIEKDQESTDDVQPNKRSGKAKKE